MNWTDLVVAVVVFVVVVVVVVVVHVHVHVHLLVAFGSLWFALLLGLLLVVALVVVGRHVPFSEEVKIILKVSESK